MVSTNLTKRKNVEKQRQHKNNDEYVIEYAPKNLKLSILFKKKKQINP
jgi:hypothetical protein